MSKPLVVLTGAMGRLGAPTHQVLLEAGLHVRAVDRKVPRSAPRSVIKADLHRPAACRKILEGATTLVHLAYLSDPKRDYFGHSFGTFDDHIRLNSQVFRIACDMGVRRFIFASSIQVVAPQMPNLSAVQPPRYLPLDEHSPVAPDNWYGLAKLCTEELLAVLHRNRGIDYTIFRFPALARLHAEIGTEWFRHRVGEAMSYLTYLDAAHAIRAAVQAELTGGRIYLPASRHNGLGIPPQELIRIAFEGVPLRKQIEEIDSLVDLSTIKRDLGWEPLELTQPPLPRKKPSVWARVGTEIGGKPWTLYRIRKLVLKPVPVPLKTAVKGVVKPVVEKLRSTTQKR